MPLSKYKKINITLLLVSFVITVVLKNYWSEVCDALNCSYKTADAFLRPLYQLALGLSGMSGLLLFLPSHYFRGWLIYIFSWGFPLSYVMVAATDPASSGLFSLSRGKVTQLLCLVFGVITVLYILWHYYKQRSVKPVPVGE